MLIEVVLDRPEQAKIMGEAEKPEFRLVDVHRVVASSCMLKDPVLGAVLASCVPFLDQH